jgi:prophage DNA circulation protein
MNVLQEIRRQQRKVEKQVGRLQAKLEGLRAAARVLGNSASDGLARTEKKVISAAARAKMSRAAKRRWAKVRAGVKKAVS